MKGFIDIFRGISQDAKAGAKAQELGWREQPTPNTPDQVAPARHPAI